MPVTLPQMFGEQTLLATAFYMSGYLCRKKNMHFAHPLMTGLLLLSVPAIAACFIKLNMQLVQGWFVLVYYVIAMIGVIGIMISSKVLSKYSIAPIITYIGSKTLYILVFHFLAFKLVSSVYLYFKDLPIELLTQFPVLEKTNSRLWIIYVISGIIFPLAVWELIYKVKSYMPYGF
jgi:fucose 4-O-acetylase-like acetyltransferase